MNPATAMVVMQTATAVRREIQRWADALGDDYSIDPTTLRGACGIGSHLLLQALEERGILKATFVMGRYYRNGYEDRSEWEDATLPNHCWLVIGDTIIDITATQFEEEEELVYVTTTSDDRYKGLHEGEDAVAILLNAWDDQSPSHYPTAMPLILTQALQEVVAVNES